MSLATQYALVHTLAATIKGLNRMGEWRHLLEMPQPSWMVIGRVDINVITRHSFMTGIPLTRLNNKIKMTSYWWTISPYYQGSYTMYMILDIMASERIHKTHKHTRHDDQSKCELLLHQTSWVHTLVRVMVSRSTTRNRKITGPKMGTTHLYWYDKYLSHNSYIYLILE